MWNPTIYHRSVRGAQKWELKKVLSKAIDAFKFLSNSNEAFTVAIRPVIREPMPNFLVDGAHSFHVALAPLPPEILRLHLEQFQDVQLHHRVLHLQRPLEDWGRLKHDQHLEATQPHCRVWQMYAVTSSNMMLWFTR